MKISAIIKKNNIASSTIMDNLKKIIPSKQYELVERAGIATIRQILLTSSVDIQRCTNFNYDDIKALKMAVANSCAPEVMLGDRIELKSPIPTGCGSLDSMLNGGLRTGSITELYGESGVGKTQVSLQATLHNWEAGVVYICTEDLFPIKRFNQLKQGLPNYDSNIDYGQYIYVEHVRDTKEMLFCVKSSLPKLVQSKHVSLIVIDSVAGLFRTENNDYQQRAEELREFAVQLIYTLQKHAIACLCLNQVTAAMDNSSGSIPSLGLAWSNMIATRLHISKTLQSICLDKSQMAQTVREISVIFAPDLPNSSCKCIIAPNGIVSL